MVAQHRMQFDVMSSSRVRDMECRLDRRMRRRGETTQNPSEEHSSDEAYEHNDGCKSSVRRGILLSFVTLLRDQFRPPRVIFLVCHNHVESNEGAQRPGRILSTRMLTW
jgi:hypothetical protein